MPPSDHIPLLGYNEGFPKARPYKRTLHSSHSMNDWEDPRERLAWASLLIGSKFTRRTNRNVMFLSMARWTTGFANLRFYFLILTLLLLQFCRYKSLLFIYRFIFVIWNVHDIKYITVAVFMHFMIQVPAYIVISSWTRTDLVSITFRKSILLSVTRLVTPPRLEVHWWEHKLYGDCRRE